MTFWLALGCLACGLFDCWFSRRRIRRFGVALELNQGLREDTMRLGVERAVIKRILIPTIVGCLLGVYFRLPLCLAFWLGAKVNTTYYQLITIHLEDEIEEHLKKIGGH